jgi:hypothetical protein
MGKPTGRNERERMSQSFGVSAAKEFEFGARLGNFPHQRLKGRSEFKLRVALRPLHALLNWRQ